MSRPPLPNVSSKYGAPMGRCDHAHPGNEYKVYVHQIPVNAGGNDKGGAYWGLGAPLFRAISADGEFACYRRARNRRQAVAALRIEFPSITFYRSYL